MSARRRAVVLAAGLSMAAGAEASAHEYGPPGVMFGPAGTDLDAGAQAMLDEAAGVLARHPTLRLCIEGHVDGAEANHGVDLDQRRATVVRDALLRRGVRAAQLGPAVGFGAGRPLEGRRVGDAFIAAEHPRNRRVELRVPRGPECERPPAVDSGR